MGEIAVDVMWTFSIVKEIVDAMIQMQIRMEQPVHLLQQQQQLLLQQDQEVLGIKMIYTKSVSLCTIEIWKYIRPTQLHNLTVNCVQWHW